MTDNEIMENALRRIAEACATPFGKDARTARRIAKETLAEIERRRAAK